MNFKQYDDGKEGRFFVILDSGMEAGWIQYKWLDNGNIRFASGGRTLAVILGQTTQTTLTNIK